MSDCLMCDVLCKERDEHWDARIDAEAARDLLKAALVECKAKLKKRDADYCEALLDAERFDASWMSEREVARKAEADLALQRARAEAQLARATRLEGENANLRANLDVAVEEKRKAEARVRDCFPCERWETPE